MKNVFFSIALMLTSISFFAQGEIYDRKVYYGISLGLSQPLLIVKEEFDSHFKVNSLKGIKVGIFSEINFTKTFSLSPRFEFSLSGDKLTRNNIGQAQETYSVIPASLDLMLHAIFKMGKNKLNPYFIIGPDYEKTLSSKKDNPKRWSTKDNFAINTGIGMEMIFKRFIMSPEIRYSFGLKDVNTHPDIKSIKMNLLSLVFVFKG